MEELTKTQEKHKQKIELISRLIDQKAVTFEEGLLLLSNTEEEVIKRIPSGPITRGVQTPPYHELPFVVTCGTSTLGEAVLTMTDNTSASTYYKVQSPTNNID